MYDYIISHKNVEVVLNTEVLDVKLNDPIKIITKNKEYLCKNIILP